MQLLNLIDGRLQAAQKGSWLETIEPATGQVYAQIPDSDAGDIELAVSAAQQAFGSWSETEPELRSAYLMRLADLIDRDCEQLAADESQDSGKPLSLARQVDIPRAALNFRFFATAIQHFSSESHQRPGYLNYTLRAPLGVGACISPWNLPLYLLSWKIAPALAAGNTVVAKASEVTPLTAFRLSELALEAGIPAGVLNIVHGSGAQAGDALTRHRLVKAISFTGSTRTGAEIQRVTAGQFKKLSLEMGGKNAAVIFADCDYQAMLETVLRSSFSNQGQICLCTSRLLVERPLYERFCKDFVARVRQLRVGDPLLPETQQGAVVSGLHQQKILDCLQTARHEGAQVLCGGVAVSLSGRCQQGFFVAPTVLSQLGPHTQTNQQEIFGPVVSIQAFDGDSEALALANATNYGLAASLWTRDQYRVQHFSRALAAGIVWVNCWMARDLRTPFGGIKESGLGREGGWEALRFWTEPKNVCIAG